MRQGELTAPALGALVAYANVGVRLLASRLLSLLALCGFFALSWWALYPPVHWLGAVHSGLAALVFLAALYFERERHDEQVQGS